jgi:hypothetical protein
VKLQTPGCPFVNLGGTFNRPTWELDERVPTTVILHISLGYDHKTLMFNNRPVFSVGNATGANVQLIMHSSRCLQVETDFTASGIFDLIKAE